MDLRSNARHPFNPALALRKPLRYNPDVVIVRCASAHNPGMSEQRPLEMHQIRYFLAVSDTLNFTRAAEQCHVAQPSLTRAIKKLEDELGGDLFRREGRRTHATELGRMMLPPLNQCYESARAAKELAGSYLKGDHAPLCLALTRTIDLRLLTGPLAELENAFPGLELKFFRGTVSEVGEQLKSGDSEVAVAGPLGDAWERFVSWPLFSEPFILVVNKTHPLSRRNRVDFDELAGEKILARPYCEQAGEMTDLMQENQVAENAGHAIVSESDLVALIEANAGVAIMPKSARFPDTLRSIELEGLSLRRTVQVYAVEGRPRSSALIGLIKLLRASDWERVLH